MKLLVLPLIFFTQLYAATFALVSVEQAIIYADQEKTSKLGFIKKGKKIRIGTARVSNTDVFPLFYNGRIVYIKKKDVQTSSELEAIKSARQRIQEKSLGDRYQRLGLELSLIPTTLDANESYDGELEKQFNFTKVGIRGDVVIPAKKSIIQINLNFYSGSRRSEEISMIGLSLNYHRRFFEMEQHSFSFYLGGEFLPHISYSYGDDFTKNGMGILGVGGLEYNYQLAPRFTLVGRTSLSYGKYFIDLPEFVSLDKYSPTASSTQIGIGILYSYD